MLKISYNMLIINQILYHSNDVIILLLFGVVDLGVLYDSSRNQNLRIVLSLIEHGRILRIG